MIRLKDIPKAFISAMIGIALFMGIMPDSIKGMPSWLFYLTLASSLPVGWLITTGIFKIARRFLHLEN
jgi:hypothetical protein